MIDLQVRKESGLILARGTCGVDWTQDLIDLDSVDFPMLAGLCAYLDTVFNQRQIPMVVNELMRLPTGVLPEPVSEEIRRLAAIVADGKHLYLWFCGD